MLSTFASIKSQIKFNPSKPSIDNFAFKCHYRITFILLLVFTILVCSREYFGDHISCIADNGVPSHVIQTYCFFTSTFTVVKHYNLTLLNEGYLPHPGVGPAISSDEKIYHAYYQWVPFVLFLQALMFYSTRYIWKKNEGGRIKALIDGLQLAKLSLQDNDIVANGKMVPSRHTLQAKLEMIRKDIIMRPDAHERTASDAVVALSFDNRAKDGIETRQQVLIDSHNSPLKVSRTWSTVLVACEIANLLNVLFQIWITNRFLNGLFIGLGPSLFGVDWNAKMDPLETVFPKVTKCEFHKYGPSGSLQKHDALCIMALNVINEKIFSILWFWYLILLLISIFAVIWRILTFIMYKRSVKFNELVFQTASPGKINQWNVLMVCRGCDFADWLFLYYLAKNMDGFVFKELLGKLAEELQKLEVPYDTDNDDEKGNVKLINSVPDEEFDSLKRDLKHKEL